MSRPATVMVPESGWSRPTSMRARVDLPQPDSPTRPSDSPSARSRSTPSTALTRAPPRARPIRKVLRTSRACNNIFTPVAGGGAAVGNAEDRALLGAALDRPVAARVEGAARRAVHRGGRAAGDRVEVAAAV